MKKKLRYDVTITYLFYILLAVTLMWDITSRGGEKVWRIGLICLTILFARFIFTKTFLRRSKAAYVVSLAFIFISMYLANVLSFYGIPHYDKF